MKHSVLLVEDNAAFATMLVSLLQLNGYTVSLASHGREALSMLVSETPCVILLDLQMPEMDGYAFLHALRQQRPAAPLPVVILTADEQAAARLEQQQVAVVRKPFPFATLLAVIHQYCHN
jgi:CheY-like chemotaxis protein